MTIILEHEGGLSLDKRDPAGITKYGVSLRFLRTIGMDINGDGDINSEDIIALTKPGSISIYRTFWWNKYNYAFFNHIEVASKVFDLAVNMGTVSAHKVMQRACNLFLTTKLEVDGTLGVKSFTAANTEDPIELRQALRDCAKDRYLQIIAENPAMEWAKDGWLTRAAW